MKDWFPQEIKEKNCYRVNHPWAEASPTLYPLDLVPWRTDVVLRVVAQPPFLWWVVSE